MKRMLTAALFLLSISAFAQAASSDVVVPRDQIYAWVNAQGEVLLIKCGTDFSMEKDSGLIELTPGSQLNVVGTLRSTPQENLVGKTLRFICN